MNKPSSSPANIASRPNTRFPIRYSIWKIAAAISLAAAACGGEKRDEFGPPDAAILADAQTDGGTPATDGNGLPPDGQAPCKKDTDSDGFCDEDPREVCKGMPDLRDATGNPVNTDGDLWPDACDKCATQKPANGAASHPDQDGDGLGDDMCDFDCGRYFDPFNMDADGDGVNDALDTCPNVPNPPILPPTPPPDAGTPPADVAADGLPTDAEVSPTDAADGGMPPADGEVPLPPDGEMPPPADAAADGQPTDGSVPIPDDGPPADAAADGPPTDGEMPPPADAAADAISQVSPTPYYDFKRIFTTELRTKIPLADASADSGLSANFPPPIYGGTPPPDGGTPEQQNSPRQCLPQNDDKDGDGFGEPCDIDDNDPTIN